MPFDFSKLKYSYSQEWISIPNYKIQIRKKMLFLTKYLSRLAGHPIKGYNLKFTHASAEIACFNSNWHVIKCASWPKLQFKSEEKNNSFIYFVTRNGFSNEFDGIARCKILGIFEFMQILRNSSFTKNWLLAPSSHCWQLCPVEKHLLVWLALWWTWSWFLSLPAARKILSIVFVYCSEV